MIYQYTIKSFEEIYLIGWLLNRWIFRGHAESIWHLESKAERASAALELLGPADLERLAVERFMREAQQYAHHVPDRESATDWLAFLQHYGGPTRLLDFTESIYVALFFAIENSPQEAAAVWAINEPKIFKNLDARIDNDTSLGGRDYSPSHKLINERIGRGVYEPGLLPVMPLWMSDRQSIQQGVFLYPEDLRQLPKGDGNPEGKRHVTFEDNLMAEFNLTAEALAAPTIIDSIEKMNDRNRNLQWSIIKIIIPWERELRVHLMGELQKMNVTHRTLFPGLEGLARSYSFPLEGYEASRIWAKAFTPQIFRDASTNDASEPNSN